MYATGTAVRGVAWSAGDSKLTLLRNVHVCAWIVIHRTPGLKAEAERLNNTFISRKWYPYRSIIG